MSNSELGYTANNDDLHNPGFEVGISAPSGDIVSPAEAPAGEHTSGGSNGGSLNLDAREIIPSFDPEQQREDDDAPLLKANDPRAANPETGNIGQLLTLGT